MELWLALLYPVIFGFGAMWLFRHKLLWFEAAIPVGVCIIFIAIFRFFVLTGMTTDVEYWGGTVVEVKYYEDWDEWIVQTCECCCDDDGENCTEYDCSYNEYHPAYYEVVDNNGISRSIEKEEYQKLVIQFGVKPEFTDLHRDYDTNDGDLWTAYWGGQRETYEPMYTLHKYENRVQVSESVYNYPEVTEEEKERFKLFDYPKITDRYQPSVLGEGGVNIKEGEDEFTWINSSLGKSKQLRIWMLIFKDQPPMAGQMQERYWKGGNKNEFIITVGVDENSHPDWCHVFSWSESQEAKITVTDFVLDQDVLDILETAQFVGPELEEKFERKEFKDFDYLSVDPPLWAIITCHILICIVSLISIFVGVNNDINNEGRNW